MSVRMPRALHVIDRSCGGEAVGEALVLAGRSGRILWIGPLSGAARLVLPGGAGPRIVPAAVSQLECHGRKLLEGLLEGGAVCHCWSAGAAWKVLAALGGPPGPMVIRLAGQPSEGQVAQLEELSCVQAVPIVVPTAAAAAQLRGGELAGEIHVIPPTAARTDRRQRRPARERLRIRRGEFAIVAPGEAHRRNGHKLAVWAVAILAVADLPVRLILQQTGRAAREVFQFAAEAGFSRQVVLSDAALPEVLAAGDAAAFLGPDLPPAFSAASAMAARLPIVAAETAAAREWLTHGQNALLVPPEQARAAAKALMRLIGDRKLASRLRRSARTFAAEHFGPRILRRRWQELYATLVAGRQAAAFTSAQPRR